MIPFFSVCIITLYHAKITQQYLKDVGGIPYLSIAYAAYFILIFCTADIWLQALQKDHSKKNIVNIVCVMVCSIVIIVTESRGAMLALIVWYLAMLVAIIVKKQVRKSMAVTMLLILAVAGGSYYLLTAFNNSENQGRIAALMQEFKDGEIKKAVNTEASDKVVEIIMETSGTDVFQKVDSIDTNEVNENNAEMKEVIRGITNGSSARIYLYRIAIEEANRNWLCGMGPLGYQQKYGTYPHNVILEVLADFGYIMALLFVVFALYLVTIVFRFAKYDVGILAIFIIAVGCMVKFMLSSDFYAEPLLIWIVTYAIGLKVFQKDNNYSMNRHKEKNIKE